MGRVSGSSTAVTSASSTPIPARITNTPRQLVTSSTSEPRNGATIGTAPTTRNSLANARARSWPSDRSRRIARAVTIPAATTNPWTNRPAVSSSRVGAAATSNDAAAQASRPTTTGSRRPTRSATGPMTSWPSARPKTQAVSVSWIWVSATPNSAASVGYAGR